MSRVTILHAEDDANDALLVKVALTRSHMDAQIVCVPEGQAALDYLAGVGSYNDRTLFPLPDLLLLDINMPRLDGFEVLSWARNQKEYRALPIVMLSSSDLERDKRKAEELGADDYLTKDAAYTQLVAWIQKYVPRASVLSTAQALAGTV